MKLWETDYTNHSHSENVLSSPTNIKEIYLP
jgi:hypothetical protein